MDNNLVQILVSNINLKGLANGLVDEVVEKALKKVVADSANTIDDMAMAAIWPVIEKELKQAIEEKLDLGKLLGLSDKPE